MNRAPELARLVGRGEIFEMSPARWYFPEEQTIRRGPKRNTVANWHVWRPVLPWWMVP